MVSMAEIQALADEIAEKFKPERIILFGSYAYGTPTEHSDVDLLVVLPGHFNELDKMIEIRQAIRAKFPLDLLVRTSETLAWRIANRDDFLLEVTTKGKDLYASDYSRVG
jgi:predicted nucleotidyltransferase